MPTEIKILMVMDGILNPTGTYNDITLRHPVNFPSGGFITVESDFGLGPVRDALAENLYYPSVNFVVTSVTREGAQKDKDVSAVFDRTNFRFTDTLPDGSLYISQFHQIWLFGFHPLDTPIVALVDGVSQIVDQSYSKNDFFKINANEVANITAFMNAGGGVLAMGDHYCTGASLCDQVPRVKQMRKWKPIQNPPLRHGPTRHDTIADDPEYNTQPFIPSGDAQGDSHPQTIFPAFRTKLKLKWPGGVEYIIRAHPVFQKTGGGVINLFPDHAHEGETMGTPWNNDNLFYSPLFPEPPNLGGINYTDTAEWPMHKYASVGQVKAYKIAYGKPDNNPRHQKNTFGQTFNVAPGVMDQNYSSTQGYGSNDDAMFGLVSVYDGHEAAGAGVGRVVVDSTWHHWLFVNTDNLPPDVMNQVKNYWLNVAWYLIPKSASVSIAISSFLSTVISSFRALKFVGTEPISEFAMEAVKDLNTRFGDEFIDELMNQVLPAEMMHSMQMMEAGLYQSTRGKKPVVVRSGRSLSSEFYAQLSRNAIGGMFKEVYLQLIKQMERPFDNPGIEETDAAKLMKRGMENGLKQFQEEMKANLDYSARAFSAVQNQLASFQPEARQFSITKSRTEVNVKLSALCLCDELFAMKTRRAKYYLVAECFRQHRSYSGKIRIPSKGFLNWEPLRGGEGVQTELNVSLAKEKFTEGERLHVRLWLHSNDSNKRGQLIWESVLTGDPVKWGVLHEMPAEPLEVPAPYHPRVLAEVETVVIRSRPSFLPELKRGKPLSPDRPDKKRKPAAKPAKPVKKSAKKRR